MNTFPKIKGIRWLSEDFPDLVAIDVMLVDKSLENLDIAGFEAPQIKSEIKVDLSKLAAVSYWYPRGQDEPSETECSVDVEGVNGFVANVPVKNLVEAWLFCKKFKYAHDTRNI